MKGMLVTGENLDPSGSHIPSRRELRAQREAALRRAEQDSQDQSAPSEPLTESGHVPVIEDYENSFKSTWTKHNDLNKPVVSGDPTPDPEEVPVQEYPSDAMGLGTPTSRSQNDNHAKSTAGRNILASVIVLLLLCALGYGIYYAAIQVLSGSMTTTEDYEGTGTGEATVEIPAGASGTQIAHALAERGIIASKQSFINALAINPEGSNIQPGTYQLRNHMSSSAALAALLDQANRLDTAITIPEGFRLTQLKARLVENAGYKPDEVDAAFGDAQGIGLPAEANGNPEGWILPGTYLQKPGESAVSLVKSMVARTVSLLDSLDVPADQRQSVLIKASILEREVSIKKYMPKVARVIENRLDPERGKEVLNKLQMDSTVSYASGRTSGIPTAAELKNDSPYNTYLHAGLPPTPIAFPGKDAIKAVLNPEPGNWLYFVSVNLETGETVFADNYEQFKEAKAQLKQFCQDNPKSC